jgi:hypothetical protein
MFARGAISLHTAQLSVSKTLASKSRVSITSKLIEIKGLQVPYFGHLRETGGWGVPIILISSPSSALPSVLARPPQPQRRRVTRHSPALSVAQGPLATSSISIVSPTYATLRCKSNDSPTYAKTGGWGPFPPPTFKYHLKCRRADIFDFSPDFSHFFPSAPNHRLHPAPREEQEGWHKSQRYIWECRE